MLITRRAACHALAIARISNIQSFCRPLFDFAILSHVLSQARLDLHGTVHIDTAQVAFQSASHCMNEKQNDI
jgi:hypothetical protein